MIEYKFEKRSMVNANSWLSKSIKDWMGSLPEEYLKCLVADKWNAWGRDVL